MPRLSSILSGIAASTSFSNVSIPKETLFNSWINFIPPSFFPIMVDTIIGLRSSQPETVYLVRAMGGTPYQVFRHVRFPNALPAIFGGLKVASTLAVIGAIVGEFVSSDTGLGYLLLVANGELDTRLVFACVLVLTLLGLAFFFAIEAMEKVFVRWHVSARQAEAAASGE